MVPTYRDDAVVLRTQKLGEADRILTMLTRQHGKVRAVAKGVRRTSSKFGARLEPFMAVDAQLYIGRNLDIVQQVDQLGAYGAAIAADYDRYLAANAMAEAADRLVSEGDVQPQQFFLLVGALRSLSKGEHGPHSTRDSYLLRALGLGGWPIQLEACAQCGELGPHEFFSAHAGEPCAGRARSRERRARIRMRSRTSPRCSRGTGNRSTRRIPRRRIARAGSSRPTHSTTSSGRCGRSAVAESLRFRRAPDRIGDFVRPSATSQALGNAARRDNGRMPKPYTHPDAVPFKPLDWTGLNPPRFTGPVPNHVAVVMDGNGRWANQQGRPARRGIGSASTRCST